MLKLAKLILLSAALALAVNGAAEAKSFRSGFSKSYRSSSSSRSSKSYSSGWSSSKSSSSSSASSSKRSSSDLSDSLSSSSRQKQAVSNYESSKSKSYESPSRSDSAVSRSSNSDTIGDSYRGAGTSTRKNTDYTYKGKNTEPSAPSYNPDHYNSRPVTREASKNTGGFTSNPLLWYMIGSSGSANAKNNESAANGNGASDAGNPAVQEVGAVFPSQVVPGDAVTSPIHTAPAVAKDDSGSSTGTFFIILICLIIFAVFMFVMVRTVFASPSKTRKSNYTLS